MRKGDCWKGNDGIGNAMEKHHIELIVKEVENFNKLQKKYGYDDINDLIAHYIEEQIITSEEELLHVLKTLKLRLGKVIEPDLFKEWWV
jgi:hypothetical protein